MLSKNFCPGCGENNLRKLSVVSGLDLGYESPCTRFAGLLEDTIRDILKNEGKSPEVIDAVLEFYFQDDLEGE